MNSYNFLIYLCILLKVNKFHKHYAKAFTIQSEVSQNYHNFTHPIPRVIDWTQNYVSTLFLFIYKIICKYRVSVLFIKQFVGKYCIIIFF